MALGIAMLVLFAAPESMVAVTDIQQSKEPTKTITETAAVESARKWLALVDAGDWRASWAAASKTFQALNTPDRWAAAATAVQSPLGKVIEHTFIREEFVPAPPTGYQLVKFRSRYANRADMLLTITLEREGEQWAVAGIMLD